MSRSSDGRLLASLATAVQVISVVVGVAISVLAFKAAQEKEVEARKLEAIKPFLELRQEFYRKAIEAAAVLSNSDIHTDAEIQAAKKQFRDLYVAQLSMVECPNVEGTMIALANEVDPSVTHFSPAQLQAYNLSHALRDSLIATWKIECPPR